MPIVNFPAKVHNLKTLWPSLVVFEPVSYIKIEPREILYSVFKLIALQIKSHHVIYEKIIKQIVYS